MLLIELWYRSVPYGSKFSWDNIFMNFGTASHVMKIFDLKICSWWPCTDVSSLLNYCLQVRYASSAISKAVSLSTAISLSFAVSFLTVYSTFSMLRANNFCNLSSKFLLTAKNQQALYFKCSLHQINWTLSPLICNLAQDCIPFS